MSSNQTYVCQKKSEREQLRKWIKEISGFLNNCEEEEEIKRCPAGWQSAFPMELVLSAPVGREAEYSGSFIQQFI